jgi:hypothetical protein
VQPKECQMTLTDFRDRLRRQEQRNNDHNDDLVIVGVKEGLSKEENNADVDIHQRPLVHRLFDCDDATTSSDDLPLPENSVVYYSRQVRTRTYWILLCGCMMDPSCMDYAYCILDTANSLTY